MISASLIHIYIYGYGNVVYGLCVVRGGGVVWGGLLKMHTQASRGNDFSTLLFAMTFGNYTSVSIFSRYLSVLYIFITADVDFSFE